MTLPPFDRARARELLKERAASPLTAYQIGSKAHRRWDLGQHTEAAILFCVACERAVEEFAGGRSPVDKSPNSFVRAAINFNRAGSLEIAEPMLREATAIDWKAAQLPMDSHMTEWAFVELLLNRQRGPREAFSQLFDEATDRCRELGWRFPKIRPKREALLAAALELGDERIARVLVELIKGGRPISRDARALLRRAAERFPGPLGSGPPLD
jgi:hypothetical protein